ncbi:transposase [Thermosulfurimonas sp. F29]|uniref:transposase n=1 Tax=Thermosulfurimonas sp. F29 TaxID=2867247 RepID=UPI001C82CDF0|nr:transposase [Thermosulfurimonas sp. F29]MBX6423271.1 transposase [Thermosulfurimonas sp. F29]
MKKFTIDQIIRILAEADSPGNSVAAIARKYGVSRDHLPVAQKIPRVFSIQVLLLLSEKKGFLRRKTGQPVFVLARSEAGGRPRERKKLFPLRLPGSL